MQNTDLINLWKSYDRKLDELLVFNKKNTLDLKHAKIKSLLSSMKPIKIFTVLLGLVWILFLNTLVIKLFFIASPYFIFSAIAICLLNMVAIGLYIYQLITLHEVNFDTPLIENQKKLFNIRSTTLTITRILLLQLPFWTVFYWNKSMLSNGNVLHWIIQILVTLGFTILSLWLFFNIKMENEHKKWFQLIFRGDEWSPLMKSIEMMEKMD